MRHHQFVIEWRARAPAAKSRRRATEGPVTKMVSPGCAPLRRTAPRPGHSPNTVTAIATSWD